jgi:hypothetical protein
MKSYVQSREHIYIYIYIYILVYALSKTSLRSDADRYVIIRNVLDCITIIVLDIIHRLVFYLKKKNEVSEIRFCLRLQVEPTQLGPIGRATKPEISGFLFCRAAN